MGTPISTLALIEDGRLLLHCRYCSLYDLLSPLEAFLRFGEEATFQEVQRDVECRRCEAKAEFIRVCIPTADDLFEIAHPGKRNVRNGRKARGGSGWAKR